MWKFMRPGDAGRAISGYHGAGNCPGYAQHEVIHNRSAGFEAALEGSQHADQDKENHESGGDRENRSSTPHLCQTGVTMASARAAELWMEAPGFESGPEADLPVQQPCS